MDTVCSVSYSKLELRQQIPHFFQCHFLFEKYSFFFALCHCWCYRRRHINLCAAAVHTKRAGIELFCHRKAEFLLDFVIAQCGDQLEVLRSNDSSHSRLTAIPLMKRASKMEQTIAMDARPFGWTNFWWFQFGPAFRGWLIVELCWFRLWVNRTIRNNAIVSPLRNCLNGIITWRTSRIYHLESGTSDYMSVEWRNLEQKICANFHLELVTFFSFRDDMTRLPIEDDDTIFVHRPMGRASANLQRCKGNWNANLCSTQLRQSEVSNRPHSPKCTLLFLRQWSGLL